MAISEQQKRRLFDRLRARLDEETAELLMEVTVPANVDLATRADIIELRGEMRAELGELRGEMRAGFAELERRLFTRLLPIMSAVLATIVTAATIIGSRLA